MAVISFNAAKEMVINSKAWLKNVSELINGTATQPPPDLYNTQKLAFEIDKAELTDLLTADKIVGILGYEGAKASLSFIIVGVDGDYKPSSSLPPCQTWPLLKAMKDSGEVLNVYLEP